MPKLILSLIYLFFFLTLSIRHITTCFENREDKLKKAQKMTLKLHTKLKSELEMLEKKIFEDREELKNLQSTPGINNTKKLTLFQDAISNIYLYKRKVLKLNNLKRNSNIIEQKLDNDHIIQTLQYCNEIISEGERDDSEVIRDNIQKLKEEEAKTQAHDNLLSEADTLGYSKKNVQEIQNF